MHPRLRRDGLFPQLIRERGAYLLPQGQKAARACRLRRRPQRVTPVERRRAARTACSLPIPRTGVGATFCDSITACQASARGPLPVTRASADPGNRSVRIHYKSRPPSSPFREDMPQFRIFRVVPVAIHLASPRGSPTLTAISSLPWD